MTESGDPPVENSLNAIMKLDSTNLNNLLNSVNEQSYIAAGKVARKTNMFEVVNPAIDIDTMFRNLSLFEVRKDEDLPGMLNRVMRQFKPSQGSRHSAINQEDASIYRAAKNLYVAGRVMCYDTMQLGLIDNWVKEYALEREQFIQRFGPDVQVKIIKMPPPELQVSQNFMKNLVDYYQTPRYQTNVKLLSIVLTKTAAEVKNFSVSGVPNPSNQ